MWLETEEKFTLDKKIERVSFLFHSLRIEYVSEERVSSKMESLSKEIELP